MTYWLQQLLNGIALGFVYALIALGYTMVYGIVRLINFAHGDVFMVGAFVSLFVLRAIGSLTVTGAPWADGLILFLITVVASMVVCAALNVVIERLAYKPLRNAPRIAALITAIGVSLSIEFFTSLRFLFGPDFVRYPTPLPSTSWTIAGLQVSAIQVLIAGVAIVLLLGLNYVVRYTKMGKAMRATAFDRDTARLMGIDVDLTISFTFGLGAALAGAAGVLYATSYPQLYTFMGIVPGLKAFTAAVMGGIGSIPGAFVGALIMGVAEVAAKATYSTMADGVAFLILIVVLLVKPSGIFGEAAVEKV
ncbi:MAG TPA: branched-chain amino acid ABC transporter permease [Anaerolineae bacterium]|nr:branched-chain amino acid ABC transporter permease [Anaerolineae bacterium]HOQ99243.1 branched-chain amino acid ABC transporter permease [Anaerolineae bacterium]HPL30596.1 branched-chain amino acid ABC transporter permease [Anaerolineae bacterium]